MSFKIYNWYIHNDFVTIETIINKEGIFLKDLVSL